LKDPVSPATDPRSKRQDFVPISVAISSATTAKGPLVVSGKSGESRLVAIVSGVIRMKRNASDHVLSAQDVALIKSWIDAGAR
jgi:hypothetical protein